MEDFGGETILARKYFEEEDQYLFFGERLFQGVNLFKKIEWRASIFPYAVAPSKGAHLVHSDIRTVKKMAVVDAR